MLFTCISNCIKMNRECKHWKECKSMEFLYNINMKPLPFSFACQKFLACAALPSDVWRTIWALKDNQKQCFMTIVCQSMLLWLGHSVVILIFSPISFFFCTGPPSKSSWVNYFFLYWGNDDFQLQGQLNVCRKWSAGHHWPMPNGTGVWICIKKTSFTFQGAHQTCPVSNPFFF